MPTGAGNDFARGLGYDPKHPLDAFDALEHGHDRVIDLGRVNGRWYTCVTASGFDAEANRWANTVHRLSGTALYVAAVLRTLAVYKPHPFRLTVDGETHECRAWLVAVGNGPAYGGGMNIAPSASLDDGLLDVTVVGEMTRVQMLAELPEGLQGHARDASARQHVPRRARRARVARPVGADGRLRRRRARRPAARDDGSGARRAHRARAVGPPDRRSTPDPPDAPGDFPAAASACVSVIGGPVTWMTPCMPAARWPGTAQ